MPKADQQDDTRAERAETSLTPRELETITGRAIAGLQVDTSLSTVAAVEKSTTVPATSTAHREQRDRLADNFDRSTIAHFSKAQERHGHRRARRASLPRAAR